MIDPLHISFEVSCPTKTAFSLWTERASSWWPVDHSASGEAAMQIVFEDRVGGRIYERTASGKEYEWGMVTAWEPPSRLAYRWHLHFAPDEATDVEIQFIEVAGEITRVEIVHTGWERLGEKAAKRREGNRLGWTSVTPHFVEAIDRAKGF